ncbi:MAG: hypothetical protein H6835_00450 [Planctomycetes bacterium]|nr:hypothetical protein [Planctomycetota bacterium]
MVDLPALLLLSLVLLLAAVALTGVVGLLRGRRPPAEVAQGVQRAVAWILICAAGLLLAEGALLALADCSFRDFERELRWAPSLRHVGSFAHHLLLAAGLGVLAAVLWSPATRRAARRPFAALRCPPAAAARRLPGLAVMVVALFVAALLAALRGLGAIGWICSGEHWELLTRGREPDALDLARVAPLFGLPVAWALALLATRLRARRHGAFQVALSLSALLFVAFAASTGYFLARALEPRSSISLGVPELGVLWFAPPTAVALWATCYLFVRRRCFDEPRPDAGAVAQRAGTPNARQ